MNNNGILCSQGIMQPGIPALFFAGLLILLVSCRQEPRESRSTAHIMALLDDTVVKYNNRVVGAEEEEITDYIARHGWRMTKTMTGLRYMIYEHGKGASVVKGDEVRLKFELSLLNGNKVYSSDSLGLKIVFPGTAEGETGLQEALLLMRKGDHAKLLVPSHLAYGLLGDMKRIPARATLVYDVEIVSIGRENR